MSHEKASMGDSRKIYLSTADDTLGVMFAKNQETSNFNAILLKIFNESIQKS